MLLVIQSRVAKVILLLVRDDLSGLREVMVTAINQILCYNDYFLINLLKNIENIICHENNYSLPLSINGLQNFKQSS